MPFRFVGHQNRDADCCPAGRGGSVALAKPLIFDFNGTRFTSSGITVSSPEKVLHILNSRKHRSGCRFINTEGLKDERGDGMRYPVVAVAGIYRGNR